MSEAPKFTRGPWEAYERGDYSDFDGNSNVIIGDDRRIAVVQNSGTEEDDANARLIEQAPMMLDALKGLVRYVEAIRCHTRMGPNQLARLEKAKAVIAKVEESGS